MDLGFRVWDLGFRVWTAHGLFRDMGRTTENHIEKKMDNYVKSRVLQGLCSAWWLPIVSEHGSYYLLLWSRLRGGEGMKEWMRTWKLLFRAWGRNGMKQQIIYGLL